MCCSFAKPWYVRDSFRLVRCVDKLLKVRVGFDGKPLKLSGQRPFSVHRIEVKFGLFSNEGFNQAKDCPNVKNVATDDHPTLLFILC